MSSNELSKLGSKDFNCQAFVRRQISSLDDIGLQELKSKLKDANKQAQSEVHHILSSNQKSFLNLTEQLTAIEVEQMSISHILQEIKLVFQSLDLDAGPQEEAVLNTGTDLTDDIVDLNEIVGNINRKVLHVSYYCYHLTGQYPDKKIYRIFLFTDTFVITVRKRKGQHARTKEYVDSFVPLSKLVLQSSNDNELYILNSESNSEYKLRFEKAKNKTETFDAIKAVLGTLINHKSHLRQLSNTPQQAAVKQETTTMTSLNVEHFNTIMDQLQDTIHMRQFDQSTVLYNEAKTLLLNAGGHPSDPVLQQCNLRSTQVYNKLVAILHQQLNNQTNSKKHVINYTKWLIELGNGEEAAKVFLNMRSILIKQRARQILYQGDMVVFISDLSFVLFSLIKNTGDWFTTSFKDAMMISIYVKWAREEVGQYVVICQRHLNQTQFSQLRRVAQVLYQIEHHAELLNKSGLFITYIIHDLLGNHILEKLREQKNKSALLVGKSAVEDDLINCIATNAGLVTTNTAVVVLQHSKSAQLLIDNIKGFTELAASTKHLIIRNECYMAIETLLEAYFHVLKKIVEERIQLSETDLQMVIMNMLYINQVLLKETVVDLSDMVEFNNCATITKRVNEGKNKIIGMAIQKYSPFLATTVYKFNELNLGEDVALNNTQLPSHSMGNVVFKLKNFSNLLVGHLEVIGLLISALLVELSRDIYWVVQGKLRNLGVGGIEMLILDVQYLIRSFEGIVNEDIKVEGKNLLEKSIKSYFEKCTETGKQPKQVKESAWFDQQVASAISQVNK